MSDEGRADGEEAPSPGDSIRRGPDQAPASGSDLALATPNRRSQDAPEAAATMLGGLVGRFRSLGGGGMALPLATWSIPFLSILGIAVLIFIASFWLDVVTSAIGQQEGAVTLAGLVQSVLHQDLDQARNTLGGLGEVMAAVLGLALTVSSIIVQLAATRFTPHITGLFFRARTNLLVLGFFVTCSVYVLWVNFAVGDQYLPRWGVLFSMLLMTASLLLLFPYFAYVFDFLDPEKIVGRIMDDGLEAATPERDRKGQRIEARQAQSVAAVEHLANIGLNALQQKDKGIASDSIDALCEFGIRYGDQKLTMKPEWHRIPDWNRQSPDFVSLSAEAIADLERRETWLEWKIMRQYQMLFGESLGQIKDTCYLIAIDTRRLGEAAGRRGDIRALDLAIKFFNTYLRATLNASDIRTAYNILHQYRQLAEFVLREGAGDESGDRVQQHRALQIAKFMRYYSGIGYQRGLTFITEVIAHDVGQLCELAFRLESPEHDDLLQVFLAVDEHAETKEQEKSLRGVRRAQIKLATTYLRAGRKDYARKIYFDMIDEPADRLQSIWSELRSLDTREFWEVNDRGTNFDYLTPEQKAQLATFFDWFKCLEPVPDATDDDGRRQTISSLLPK